MSKSFLAELKRRNVIRFAGLYLVGAWLLVQVAGTVLPMFGAPDWLPRSIVILLAIGLLPALRGDKDQARRTAGPANTQATSGSTTATKGKR